jgi:hypothetical protein
MRSGGFELDAKKCFKNINQLNNGNKIKNMQRIIIPLDIDKEAFEARVLSETGVKLFSIGVDEVRRKPLICYQYMLQEREIIHSHKIYSIAQGMQLEFIKQLI